jgi:hypothetical protein
MIVSKREKGFFIITLWVILLSLNYAFIIEPLYKRYISLNKQIKTKQWELAKNLRVISERDMVIKEFQRYSQYFASKGFSPDMAFLLTEIEKIAKLSGISLNDVKPQGLKDVDTFGGVQTSSFRARKEYTALSINPEPFDKLRANGEFIEPEQTSGFGSTVLTISSNCPERSRRISPRCVEWVDFRKILSLEIKFQATTKGMVKFIYELENSKLLLKVSYLQLYYKQNNQSLLEGVIHIGKICL